MRVQSKAIGKIKCNLRNKSALEIWFKSKVVLKCMNGNPNFPFPNPYLERLAVYSAEMGNILKQRTSDLQLAQRNSAQGKLTQAIREVAGYVASVSLGNTSIILSSGFDVRKKRSKTQLRPAPRLKRYIKIKEHGWVKLMWHADTAAFLYKVYVSGPDYAEPIIKTTSKSSLIIKGLESAKKYSVAVSALNTAGESNVSNEMTIYEAWL
jgi:hypothetical protein